MTISLTERLLKRPFEYVENELHPDKHNNGASKTSLAGRHVLYRGAKFALAPVAFITCTLDTIVGLGYGLGTIRTLGTHKPTWEKTIIHLRHSREILLISYAFFLTAINPRADFPKTGTVISSDGRGLTTNLVFEPIKKVGINCRESDNFLKKHVASRLTYALLAISCLVTRAVDGIIGVPAAALSILTCGSVKFGSLHNVAYRGLQTTGIIDDLFYCTIKFINPWAGIFPSDNP